MRLTKTLVAAAIAGTVTSTSALAGGLAVEIVEPPVVVVEPVEETRSSLGYILPLVAVAGLVALAASSDNDDNGTATTTN